MCRGCLRYPCCLAGDKKREQLMIISTCKSTLCWILLLKDLVCSDGFSGSSCWNLCWKLLLLELGSDGDFSWKVLLYICAENRCFYICVCALLGVPAGRSCWISVLEITTSRAGLCWRSCWKMTFACTSCPELTGATAPVTSAPTRANIL